MYREIFVGGKEKGLLALKQLLELKANLVYAYVLEEDEHEPDKFSPQIIALCKKNKIPFLLTKSIKKEYDNIKQLDPDLMIVYQWRSLIPKNILEIPKRGCICVHEALLPKYRGFAPVNWVVINGEEETGVTLFYLNEDTDSGDIIAQRAIKISKNDTAHDIYKKAAELSVLLLKEHHDDILSGKAPRKKQDDAKATYGCPRTPEDGRINWEKSNEAAHNLIRGLSYPYPGAYCIYKGEKVVIQKSSLPSSKKWVGNIPGRIVERLPNGCVEVLCGTGSILIEEIEVNGSKIKPSEMWKSVRDKDKLI